MPRMQNRMFMKVKEQLPAFSKSSERRIRREIAYLCRFLQFYRIFPREYMKLYCFCEKIIEESYKIFNQA